MLDPRESHLVMYSIAHAWSMSGEKSTLARCDASCQKFCLPIRASFVGRYRRQRMVGALLVDVHAEPRPFASGDMHVRDVRLIVHGCLHRAARELVVHAVHVFNAICGVILCRLGAP